MLCGDNLDGKSYQNDEVSDVEGQPYFFTMIDSYLGDRDDAKLNQHENPPTQKDLLGASEEGEEESKINDATIGVVMFEE